MAKIVFNEVSSDASTISNDHFGLNFVADYERIGDRGWETFDEIAESVGTQNLRYPGGVFAEAFFDIRNPNATHVELESGHMQQVMPLHDFLKYAESANMEVSVIIPMTQPLTNDSYGNRTFDEAWYGSVFKFVYSTLAAQGGDMVSVFELGNEYEGYMTSQEYGRVASRISKITQNAIDKFKEDRNLNDTWEEPEIAVQSWTLNVQNSLTLDEQSARNNAVMEQFSADEIATVDRIVSHFYYEEGRFAGQSNEQTLSNIENAVSASVNIVDEWESKFGKSFTVDYSEWNVSHFAGNVTGMAQLPAVISMFESFTEVGVDAMSFWSAMYHATSLGLNNGELTAVGQLMRVMQEELVGFRALDTTENIENAEVSAFTDGNSVVMFISSTQAGNNTFTFDASSSFDGYYIHAAQTIETDLSKADGVYRNLTDLPTYFEPDLPAYLADFALPENFTTTGGTLTLSSHQTLIIEMSKSPLLPVTFYVGTLDNDIHTFSGDNPNFDGLDGFDTVSAAAFGSAVVWDLQNDKDGDGNIRFNNIEALTGSTLNDVLSGDNGGNLLVGGAGNDQISTRGGNDTVVGGAGDDFAILGDGQDTFVFETGDGKDAVRSFDVDQDILAMDALALSMITDSDFKLAQYSFGTKLILDNNQGSIDFKGLSGSEVSTVLQNAIDTSTLDFL